LELLVHSRSPDKGIELASRFGGTFVADLAAVGAADVAVVVSTVPAAAAFTLPANVLAARPVVLDVVYKPVRTPLVEQALANDCACIQGATMLLEQGVQQFEIWNGRRAPRTEMEAAVFEGIEKI
jgi:shikimate 5-dehydrogenase